MRRSNELTPRFQEKSDIFKCRSVLWRYLDVIKNVFFCLLWKQFYTFPAIYQLDQKTISKPSINMFISKFLWCPGHYFNINELFWQIHIQMKTPMCCNSRKSMGYKTPKTILTFGLDLWPWPLWPWPWTIFSETRLKFFLHFWPRWPLPLTYDLDQQTCSRYDGPECMHHILGSQVQRFSLKSANRHTHTDTHTDGLYRKYYFFR